MMRHTVQRGGRPLCVAALLTTGLLLGPLLTPDAHAIIGGCGGDPIVVLSNRVTIDLSTVANDSAPDVRRIVYTLRAPVGTRVVSVTALGVREVLRFDADNGPGRYDTVTRVDASTAHVAVTTTTSVVPLGGRPATGSATGATQENLHIHLVS